MNGLPGNGMQKAGGGMAGLRGLSMGEIDLPLKMRVYPLGFAVDILTNSEDVLEAAAKSFMHRRPQHGETGLEVRVGVLEGGDGGVLAAPVRRQFEHLYTMVAGAGNQAVLDLLTGANHVWLERAAVREQMYLRQNFLEKVVYLLLGATVVVDIHAGCVSRWGKGILLCGDSGAGKSSLAYACARAGWTYTSDDTCYLLRHASKPRVAGHAHRVRFRPEARVLFPELMGCGVTETMEGKPSIELPVTALPVSDSAPECEVSAIVYLRRNREGRKETRLLPEGSGVERLTAELFSSGVVRAEHERHLEVLRETPVFELHYDSLEDGVGALEEMVEGL